MGKKKSHPLMGCPDLRSQIHVGDLVKYESTGEARNVEELCRSSSATVEATGRVILVHPTYVVVELRNGVRECPHGGNIIELIKKK